jgi:hypothetical protein
LYWKSHSLFSYSFARPSISILTDLIHTRTFVCLDRFREKIES